MESASFKIGEVVAVDERIGTILEIYGLQAKGRENVNEMASVEMSNGEVCEYLLGDLGRIVEISD